VKSAPALDRTLAALADPTRRAVVELLRLRPRRAGELAASLAMSAPALSRHLRILRKSRLVTEDQVEHDARVRLYRLRPEALNPLHEWVDEMRTYWTDQLQSFKTHTEQRKGQRKA
jgi:DNA-binding transcriptional ArsR family regulator